MSWITTFLTSSIGRKLVMSLTGIFLILFLVVHLAGNLLLLAGDGGESFNLYAKFMTTNPLIKFTSYGLYFFILLHAVQGIVIWLKNRSARGEERYAVKVTRAVNTNATYASNMAWLGSIIFIFLALHLYQFWLQMKLDALPYATYDGVAVKNLYYIVSLTYENPVFVAIYVISMAFIGMHLWHGFQSAFQSLGINHPKYTTLIQGVGKIYSILVPLGFALIPILMYLNK